MTDFFAASYVPDGGAYRFRLHDDGTVGMLYRIPMNAPSYLILKDRSLYAVLRTPYADSRDSAVAVYDPETGAQLSGLISVRGEGGCHIAAAGDDVYVACYNHGSLICLPDKQVIHSGHGPNPERQEKPHVHSVVLSPDQKYVLSCDLGLDQVFVYTRDMHLVGTASTPPGAGPRHLCFSHCGNFVYCINEMGGSVTVFRWADGILTPCETVNIMPSGAPAEGAGGAIKLSLDGRRLYVTERVTNTIVTLAADGEKLSVLAHTDCRGTSPRDFSLLDGDRFSVATNVFSDSMTFFRMDADGIPHYLSTYALPAPLCAVEYPTT